MPFYHDRAAYDAFFAEMQARYGARVASIADFETLVPESAYGLGRNLSPDVFHFTDAGHRLLGTAVQELVSGSSEVRTTERHALQ